MRRSWVTTSPWSRTRPPVTRMTTCTPLWRSTCRTMRARSRQHAKSSIRFFQHTNRRSIMKRAIAVIAAALIAAPCLAAGTSVSDAGTPASAGSAAANHAVAAEGTSIRPFRVSIPQSALDDLRQRVLATRWADKETVDDQSQGVQLATIQALVQYWGTRYDWRKFESQLNSLPQFTTKIDGVDIHFIHVRSRHPNALPVIITMAGRVRSSNNSTSSVRSLTPSLMADVRRTPSTSSFLRCPATASPASRRARVGTPSMSREPGQS